jgi:hypothetical protein
VNKDGTEKKGVFGGGNGGMETQKNIAGEEGNALKNGGIEARKLSAGGSENGGAGGARASDFYGGGRTKKRSETGADADKATKRPNAENISGRLNSGKEDAQIDGGSENLKERLNVRNGKLNTESGDISGRGRTDGNAEKNAANGSLSGGNSDGAPPRLGGANGQLNAESADISAQADGNTENNAVNGLASGKNADAGNGGGKTGFFGKIAERIRLRVALFKSFPRGRRQKILAATAAVLLVVIAAPIIITSVVRSGYYKLSMSAADTSAGSVSVVGISAGYKIGGDLYVPAGNTVHVTAQPKAQYEFSGWYDGDGNPFPDESEYLKTDLTFKMIKANLDLHAEFSLIKYELSVNAVSDEENASGGRFDLVAVRENGRGYAGYKIAKFPDPDKNLNGTFGEGVTITLTVKDEYVFSGYGFYGWFERIGAEGDGGEERWVRASKEKTYEFVMGAEPRGIEARFYRKTEGGIEFDKSTDYETNSDYINPSGSGTSDDPYVYKITTKEQLALAAELINGDEYGRYYRGGENPSGRVNIFEKFVLKNDINLCGAEWTPINIFSGVSVFDGDGYEIENFKITVNAPEAETVYAGLFGRLGGTSRVQNLKISGAAVNVNAPNAAVYAGILVGRADGALCEQDADNFGFEIDGTVKVLGGKDVYAGILAGYIYAQPTQRLEKIKTSGGVSVTASDTASYAGGVAGYADVNELGEVSSSANVTVNKGSAGKLLGACRVASPKLTDSGGTGTVKVGNAPKSGDVGKTGVNLP